MTADILTFPTRAKSDGVGRLEPGDLLVTCFNATVGLWCAWPVACVDRDGVPMGVTLRNGDVMAADRVNARAEAYGFRRSEHVARAFDGLFWRTWATAEEACAAVVAAALDGAQA